MRASREELCNHGSFEALIFILAKKDVRALTDPLQHVDPHLQHLRPHNHIRDPLEYLDYPFTLYQSDMQSLGPL